MIIEVSARNLIISPASRRQIATYNLQLTKYFKKIHSIRWVIEAVRTEIEAHLQIHAFSSNYRTSASGKAIREVLVTACDSVEKQRRRRKRISERFRRTSRKIPPKFGKTHRSKNGNQSPEDFGI